MPSTPATKPCKFCQAEIPSVSVQCPKCKKIEWTKRNIILMTISAIFFSWLFISILPDGVSNTGSSDQVPIVQDSIKDRLSLGLSAANTFTSYATPTSTIDTLNAEVVLFDLWANQIRDGKASSSTEDVARAKELESKVISIQIKEFPRLRKEATRFFRNSLWEGDIDVSVSGSRNETLSLVGVYFAANKNIKTTYESMYPLLLKYRFQKVRFSWYEGADGSEINIMTDEKYRKDDALSVK